MISALASILLITLFASALLSWRVRAYRRLLNYEPSRDYAIPAPGTNVESVKLHYADGRFSLPPQAGNASSGFLEVIVKSTLLGRLSDPRLVLEVGGFKYTQYFERGARGRRLLNLSRLLLSGSRRGVVFRGRGLKCSGAECLQVYREQMSADERLLVVAPHPDDAEIAAFGLYSGTEATVVTVTAGDDSNRFDGQPGVRGSLSREMVARLRVWDSIFIPSFGNVPPERALNLCYPDGQLVSMHAAPADEFGARSGAPVDYAALRRLNTSSLLGSTAAHRCSWESLVHDLELIISKVHPTIIAAPLPLLDPHPDHALTTLAVCEAARNCGLDSARLFLYVVHTQWTELYPFGPSGGGVSLPPVFNTEGVEYDALYSLALSPEQQTWKRLALQTMHDLGEFTSTAGPDVYARWRNLKASLGAFLKGFSNPPTSYLRRAVRPEEVFFVLHLDQAERLARLHAKQLHELP